MSKVVPLNKGLCAIIDDGDFERVSSYVWHMHMGYPSTNLRPGKKIFLHQYIFGDGIMRDHKDGDALNNQRDNLRICTFGENARNAKLRIDNTTGAKGVCRTHTIVEKYEARIRVSEQRIYLGQYQSVDEAAHAYNKAAILLHGDFCKLNPVGVNPRE